MSALIAHNQADLTALLSAARGGEVIKLAPGTYGPLIIRHRRFQSTVTLTSLDPADPATITQASIRDSTHLTFDGLIFDYQAAVNPRLWERLFSIEAASDIRILNSRFDGDLAVSDTPDDHGFATGVGLFVRHGHTILIENNEFKEFYRGTEFFQTNNLVFRHNEVHAIRSDGSTLAGVQNVRLEDNYYHDFRHSPTSGDHQDFIQFWTTQQQIATSNVLIRGNIMDLGEGDASQSLFMRNERVDKGEAGIELFYRDIRIEDNLIRNNHLHGITLGEALGVAINGNILVSTEKRRDPVVLPQIRVSPRSHDVTVTDNVAHGYDFGGRAGDWILANNITLQNTKPRRQHYSFDVGIEDLIAARLRELNFTGAPKNLPAISSGIPDRETGPAPALRSPEKTEQKSTITPDRSPFDLDIRDVDAAGSELLIAAVIMTMKIWHRLL